MSLFGNKGPKHLELGVAIYDPFPGVKGAVTKEDTCINKTLDARIQVDKDGNLVHVCNGDQYRKFFQEYMYGSGMSYRLGVKGVSVPVTRLYRIISPMVNVRQDTFEIEMQGEKKSLLLPFTKKMMLASANRTEHMEVGNGRKSITVYYKLKSERMAGVDEFEFLCKCQGKHPTELLAVDG